MKSITFAFALCFAAFAAGCSNSTTPATNNNTNNSSGIPAVGTTFQTVDIDMGSRQSYDTIQATAMVDVHHTGSTVRAVRSYSIGPQTTYQSFLTNGDIAVQGSIWATQQFKVLPFASHATVRDTFFDGTAVDSIVAVYAGPGANFSINGKSYPTDSVVVSYTYGTGNTYQEEFSFIPALGVLAYDRSETDFSQSCEKLVSYGTD